MDNSIEAVGCSNCNKALFVAMVEGEPVAVCPNCLSTSLLTTVVQRLTEGSIRNPKDTLQ